MSSSSLSNFVGRIKKGAAPGNSFLLAALLIAGLAALPLWFDSGLLNTRGGGDSPFLLQRINQLAAALNDGHFPVRWMPDANYGFGYPFYNFYAPLSIYFAAAFKAIGFSYVWAVQLVQLSGFLVAAWAMFKLARRWLGSAWAAILASAAYTLAPFHMVNVYVRGDSLAEFWAMAFYPLLLLTLDAMFTNGTRRGHRAKLYPLALVALTFASVILSHNISALIFTPFVLLYLFLALWDPRSLDLEAPGSGESTSADSHDSAEACIRDTDSEETTSVMVPAFHQLLWPAAALLLGLALAAWFWLPALSESDSVQLDPVTAGYFQYDNHFRDTNLVQGSFIFNYNVAGGGAFRMGLVQTGLILAGLAYLIHQRRTNSSEPAAIKKKNLIYIAAGLLISTFMITSLSKALWANLPLLPFVQFPWRFLSVQAFFGALAVGGLGLLPAKRILVPLLLVILLVTGLAGLQLDFMKIDDRDVTPERLAEYEWFTGNIGTTVSAEYLPQSVAPRPFTSPWLNIDQRDKIQILDGRLAGAALAERRTSFQAWRLDVRSPQATLTLPILYWDGWSAAIDGNDIPIWPAPGSGLITAQLPEGSHFLELNLNRTPVRWAAEVLSAAGLVLFIFLLIWADHRWKPGRTTLIVIAAVVITALVLLIIPESAAENDDLNWDFDQLAYLHHSDDGISFTDDSRLKYVQYSADQVSAGSILSISLDWETLNSDQVALDIVSPAVNRFPDIPLIASQIMTKTEADEAFEFLIPTNAPSGLFLPALRLLNEAALTSSGQKRGELYLRPLRILDNPDLALDPHRSLSVRPLNVMQRTSTILDLQLSWLTSQQLTQNYNFSLRLADAQGLEITQFDNQPGYGFLPSSGWLPGVWVDDWLALPLPADLAQREAPYSLGVRLYDLASGEVVLLRHLGQLEWQDSQLHFQAAAPAAQLPENLVGLTADFEQQILLNGYTLRKEGDVQVLNIYWQAATSNLDDYSRFVHLVDPDSGEIITQSDAVPRNNSFPTSQWLEGSIVEDTVYLNTGDLPPGEYLIYLGLYKLVGGNIVPLAPSDVSGQISEDGRLLLPEPLIIKP